MEKALTCNVAKSVDDKDIADLFGTVCGLSKNACAGIQADASKGIYGAYGMCNGREQLGWALNAYYSEQLSGSNGGASACDFSGSATLQSAVTPTGQCSSLIKQAGGQGTGTVTAVPTGGSSGSGGSGASGSSGSGSSGSGSASGSPGAAGSVSAPSLNMGFQLGAYIVVAMVSGVAMILL